MANSYGGYSTTPAQWQTANQAAQPAFYTAAVPSDPRMQQAPQAAAVRASAPGGAAGQQAAWQTQAGWHKGGALAGGAYDQGGQAAYYVPAAQNYGQDFSQDTYNQPPQQNYQGYQQQQPTPMRFTNPGQTFTPRNPHQDIPRAEVFRAANAKITHRMRGPSPRGGRGGFRGGRGGGGNFGQQPTKQKSLNRGPALYPIQLLNEANLTGLFWQYTTAGDEKNPVFTASVKHNGNDYSGSGRTKKDAMNIAAKYLLQAIGQPVPAFMEEASVSGTCIAQLYQLLAAQRANSQIDFSYSMSGPPFECFCTFNGKQFSGHGATKKVAKASTALKILDAINSKQIAVPLADPDTPTADTMAAGATTPLGQLNAKLGTMYSLDWNIESVRSNTDNATMHTAYLTLNGREFMGHNTNKKAAKNTVAQAILDAAAAGTFELPIVTRKRPASECGEGTPETKTAKKDGELDPNMNPLSKVNHLFPGLITWAFESSGPAHCPVFNATASVQGKAYSSSAGSKKDAKSCVSNLILTAVANAELSPCPHPRKIKLAPQSARKAVKSDIVKSEPMDHSTDSSSAGQDDSCAGDISQDTTVDPGENPISALTRMFGTIYWRMEDGGSAHDPLFEARMTLMSKEFSGSAGTKKAAKLKCAQNGLASVEAGEIKPSKAVLSTPAGRVGQLWPDLVWDYKQEGNIHKPIFTAAVTIDGEPYKGLGASKKTAKLEACKSITEALEAGTLKMPEGRGSLSFSLNDIKRFNKVFGTPRIDMEDLSTAANPILKASTTIDDKIFTGQGPDIGSATESVIAAINNALKDGVIEVPVLVQFHRRFKYPRIVVTNLGTEDKPMWEATYKHWHKLYKASSDESPDAAERACARLAVDDLKNIKRQPEYDSEMQKTPCAILNEKAEKDSEKIYLQIVDKVQEGAAAPFICKATVQGQEFQGSGRSKGAAKQNCAAVILSNVYGHVFDIGDFKKPQAADDMQRGDIGEINHQDLSTKVHSMVVSKYTDAVDTVNSRFRGRKVLAGCVMIRGNDMSTAETIAVAAGTKCIHGGHMRHDGRAVNDMHAEILVRRALKRFLLYQIDLVNQDKPSIMVKTNDDKKPKYRVAPDVRLHMFISSPPCGDSRIFLASNNKEGGETTGDDNPDRQNRGQLRVKMETGQGTLPVNKTKPGDSAQSWEGIMSGDRYLNMSCCDKVARWAVLGFQGSLLSTLMEPVYISSYIIGSMFNQAHIYRGVYGRLYHIDSLRSDIKSPYRHHCPEIIGTVTPEMRNTVKPPNHAVLWQKVDDSVEILDFKTGMLMENGVSTVCKNGLFGEFRKRATEIPDSYEDCKKTATMYQELKIKVYAGLETCGFGGWVSKPVEQDMFTYQPEPEKVEMVVEVEAKNVPQMAPPQMSAAAEDPNKPMITTPN